MKYPMIISNNHYIAQIEGLNHIIDTGSPLSFSESMNINFGGQRHKMLPLRFLSTEQNLGNLAKTNVNGLIGTNLMYEHQITFNKNKMEFLVDNPEMKVEGTIGMGMFNLLIKGYPSIWLELNGKRIKALLDTGAYISYASGGLVEGMQSVGTANDYNPGLGNFTTQLYEVPYSVKGLTGTIKVGTLPKIHQIALEKLGFEAVIGMDLFNAYEVITFDFVNRRVHFGHNQN